MEFASLNDHALVTTIRDRCRVCYTCVRECPAKAIRIADGQANVVPERCIGCGKCVRVCSQSAKRVLSSKERVAALLNVGSPVAAMIAPSFPAAFEGTRYGQVVGACRSLGFRYVTEVGFGADLVAERYRQLLAGNQTAHFIATTCPAIVAYIEKYYPHRVSSLAPIVSPMVAMGRVLKKIYGSELKTVFIGPCIAKKSEIRDPAVAHAVDEAMTFVEFIEFCRERGVRIEAASESEFDPPYAGIGRIFSVAGGLLEAAEIKESLIDGGVVSVDGKWEFVESLKEFNSGALNARLLEALCCRGCIRGAGMSFRKPLFMQRNIVAKYVRERMVTLDREAWSREIERFEGLDLSRTFKGDDQRLPAFSDNQISGVLKQMGKQRPEDELNCGACGYETCRLHAMAVQEGLAESEMCLPFMIERLKDTVRDLAISHEQLASAQDALIQKEKLASMGQLAAGIAHEVNNPLGVILLYSNLLLENFGKDSGSCEDLKMIVRQAERCKRIVSELLSFARRNKMLYSAVDIHRVIQDSIRVTAMGDGVEVELCPGMENPIVEIDRNQVQQVLVNLISNAISATARGGKVVIRTSDADETFKVSIMDTGSGIRQEHIGKIFDPFFTTKKMGMGTGLGLAISYGIVKMHSGAISVTSNADPSAGPTGSTFDLVLPKKAPAEREPFEIGMERPL